MKERIRIPIGAHAGAPILLASLLAVGAGVGCSEDQVLTTTRNLDRPGPLTMVCTARVGDARVATSVPPSHCTSDAGTTDATRIKGTLYGFVANTARGEVAVFHPTTSTEPLIDLDEGSPGFGFIPVGSLPTDLKSSKDGCRVISANSGSCDLSVINVPAVMEVAAGMYKPPSGNVVSRVIPRTAAGPLRARPQEIVLVPVTVPDKKPSETCPSSSTYRIYATFPRCNLVAEIEMSSGRILQGLILGPRSSYLTRDPTCPVECLVRSESKRVDSGTKDFLPAPPDAQTPDAGVRDLKTTDGSQDAGPDVPTSSTTESGSPQDSAIQDAYKDPAAVLPYSLAINEAGDRLYVSSAGAGFITVITLDQATGAFTGTQRIPLSGQVGTMRVRLSPKTRYLGQFLYAIATDRSLRVISTDLGQECETSMDLAKLQDGGIPLDQARCYLVGAQGTPERRVTVEGTGLRFGSRSPQDVVFVQSPEIRLDASISDTMPQSVPLQGIFALVAVSDGTLYVVDVEDWTVVKSKTSKLSSIRLPHRFRNEYLGLKIGIPDASVASISGAKTGGIPVVVSKWLKAGVAGDAGLPGQGVYLRAPGETVSTDWVLTYEDLLLSRWSGSLSVESGKLLMNDKGASFCAAGVLDRLLDSGQRSLRHGDILVVVGCKESNECGVGQICAKPITTTTDYGLCIEESRQTEMFTKCLPWLNNKREYVVTWSSKDRLALDLLNLEPQRVIKQGTQPAGGCKSNDDCQPHYLCALKNQSLTGLTAGECFRPGCQSAADCSSKLCEVPLGGPADHRVCVPAPAPVELGPGCTSDSNCMATGVGKSCSSDADCKDQRAECRLPSTTAVQRLCVDKGYVCSTFPGIKGRCIRPSPCFAELLHYEVRAGRSFVVGAYGRQIADPTTGECKDNERKSALLTDRVPIGLPIYPVLLGPRCTSTPDPLGLPQPNPCFESSSVGFEGLVDKTSSTSYITDSDPRGPAIVVRYSNPDIWFSLGVSNMTHPPPRSTTTDAGVDSSSPTPPMPARGLAIKLSVGAGFSRLRIPATTAVSLPVRLVDGPDAYVYMVDIGDRSGSTGSSGQVLRILRASIKLDSFSVR